MKKSEFSKEFLAALNRVRGKRARIVVEHILEHGSISTEELETIYGYSHPPRAVRDVREQGIPIETFSIKNADSQTIAAYRFGNPDDIEQGKLGGRKTFSKKLKQELFTLQNERCTICNTRFESRYLQIDHRVPYLVAGDSNNIDGLMLLCASCNRSKSWTCEHCENGISAKDAEICKTCYWASPLDYQHIAKQEIRRFDITLQGDDVNLYDNLLQEAKRQSLSLAQLIKVILRRHIDDKN